MSLINAYKQQDKYFNIKNLLKENNNNINDILFNNKLQEFEIEYLLKNHEDEFSWYAVSCYQKLSEDFIEKYQDKFNWNIISERQKLSESFIEKYQDKVDWNGIAYCQKLSESFIEKYTDKLYVTN